MDYIPVRRTCQVFFCRCVFLPVPGKDVGEKAVFGGLFGEAYIMEVRNINRSSTFVGFGRRIPAPITSINN